MADYNLPGWSYEQQQVDSPAVATAPVPTTEPGMVTIGQEDWRTGGPGPVTVPAGQGIRLTGGLPFKPEGPLPWWTIAYEQEKQKMAEEQRIRDLVQSVPFAQQSKALESAMRLEGNLGFAADIKAGIPVQQALAKHAQKMYYNSPAASASVMSQLARPAIQSPYSLGQTIPIQGGRMVVTGPRSGRIFEDKPPLSTSQEITHIEKRIDALQKRREDTRRDSPERTKIDSELAFYEKRADDLLRQRTAVSPAGPQGQDKETIRKQGREYVNRYPDKAAAIRAKFKKEFGEEL